MDVKLLSYLCDIFGVEKAAKMMKICFSKAKFNRVFDMEYDDECFKYGLSNDDFLNDFPLDFDLQLEIEHRFKRFNHKLRAILTYLLYDMSYVKLRKTIATHSETFTNLYIHGEFLCKIMPYHEEIYLKIIAQNKSYLEQYKGGKRFAKSMFLSKSAKLVEKQKRYKEDLEKRKQILLEKKLEKKPFKRKPEYEAKTELQKLKEALANRTKKRMPKPDFLLKIDNEFNYELQQINRWYYA